MLATNSQRESLVRFFESSTRLVYKKGEVIIRPEDTPSGVYYIAEGFVKVYAITKYGEENLLIVRKTGELFPLIWAFTNEHREITYQAMEKSVLWRSKREDYLNFLQKNPETYHVVLDQAISAYQLHAERVNTLSYRTVRERVVSFLLTCGTRFAKPHSLGTIIDAPLLRHDIAASVNATRETTSRELTALARKGHIKFEEHSIILTDIPALKKLL